MNTQKVFLVTALGFSEHDHQLLKSVMWLSKSRTFSYGINEYSPNATASIVIANGDNNSAMVDWRSYQKRNPGIPMILAKKEQPSNEKGYFIRRPFVVPRILSVLDCVVKDKALQPTAEYVMSELTAGAAEKTQPSIALIVDDSLSIRKEIQFQLQTLGIKAELAESARKAFQHIKNNAYDLIFLDIALPDGDGIAICKSIKKDPSKRQTPVFICTGKSSPFDRLKGKMAGCNLYIIKPIGASTLQTAIRQYFCLREETSAPDRTVAI